MELDAAVGEMMTYLREKDLLQNTVVVLFSDHSAYYQSMANYVKDIYPQADPTNVSELYRVPMMIKIGDQKSQVKVNKFTCTADILPTTMDLLGIRYYENLYYGHSAFAEEESILYSRAYDVFMTDKMYFTSMQHITWKDGTADETYISQVAQRAEKLMNKYSYVNRIFAGDYFRGERLAEFEENMRNLNAQ
jgi:phosphoglycerol transferase MdoB-like AlkP superfamily enzyme